MHTPLTSPTITPSVLPLKSKASECQVLSAKSPRSLIKLRKTAAGPGKYGSGSKWKPDVIISQRPSNRIAAVKIGHMCRIRWRKPAQKLWAIERTIETPGISRVFLNQRSDQPNIILGGHLSAGDFFYFQGANPLVGNAVKMHKGTFGERFSVGVRRKHLCDFHFPCCTVNRFVSQADTWYVAQSCESGRVQFRCRGEIFFLDRHDRGSPWVGLDPFGAFQQGACCSRCCVGVGVHPFAVCDHLAAIFVFVRRIHYLIGNVSYLSLRDEQASDWFRVADGVHFAFVDRQA